MRLAIMASEGGAEHGTFPEYIAHHSQFLANKHQESPLDFTVIHWDTLFFSLFCAALVLILLRRAASRATTGVPGKFQALVEVLVDWVHGEAKTMVHGKLDYIAPLALTVFLWVTFMNAIDLLPVDWLPLIAEKGLGAEHLRPLPTADLNATLGMALGVLVLSIYYSFKIKGVKGYAHEMAAGHLPPVVPKINPLTWIPALLVFAANLFLFFEGMLGPTISHGFRLFGNMYAGELVFFLISGLDGSGTVFGVTLGALLGVGWGLFHIMIVVLQAFVFMMLTLAYLGRAHAHH